MRWTRPLPNTNNHVSANSRLRNASAPPSKFKVRFYYYVCPFYDRVSLLSFLANLMERADSLLSYVRSLQSKLSNAEIEFQNELTDFEIAIIHKFLPTLKSVRRSPLATLLDEFFLIVSWWVDYRISESETDVLPSIERGSHGSVGPSGAQGRPGEAAFTDRVAHAQDAVHHERSRRSLLKGDAHDALREDDSESLWDKCEHFTIELVVHFKMELN